MKGLYKRTWGDDLVVPGERIGGFLLGQRPVDFLPTDSNATLSDWSISTGVAVELDSEGRLVDATTGEANYHTEEGFTAGTEVTAIIDVWGAPDETRELGADGYFEAMVAWRARGAGLAVKEGRVLYLSVFPPAE